MWSPTANKIKKEEFVMKDINSLAHSTWNCKYHIVFAPKYRRMAIYGEIRKDIGIIIRILFSYDEKIKCSNSKGFLLTTI